MLSYMKHLQRGYTLVELLIIVVVLTILASIAIVGWEGVSALSRDRAREQDTRQWSSTFDIYRSRFVVHPIMPTINGGAGAITRCLGSPSSFPNGRCGQYKISDSAKSFLASNSSGLESEVGKVGNMPTNSNETLRDTLVGPILYTVKNVSGTITTVDTMFINFFELGCPEDDFVDITTNPTVANGVLNDLPAALKTGNNVHACAIVNSFSFDPTS